jgi:hypothetical protein
MDTGGLRGDGNDEEGQVRDIGGSGIKAQAPFIADYFKSPFER